MPSKNSDMAKPETDEKEVIQVPPRPSKASLAFASSCFPCLPLLPVSAIVRNMRASLNRGMIDADAAAIQQLPHIPAELLGKMAAMIVDGKDLLNFGLACKRFVGAMKYALGKRINGITIYPRFANMKAWLEAVKDPHVANLVHSITLLAEGLKEHEYGYAWAWEDLQIWAEINPTDMDFEIMRTIDAAHAQDVDENGAFIISGTYQKMLTTLLERLPHLTKVTIRKLAPGEQIPGWSGAKLFKKLSFFHARLDTRQIYYGDWQYDTLHRRVTQYQDEFGELVSEPHTGPQASFVDDLLAAVLTSGTNAKVSFMPIPK